MREQLAKARQRVLSLATGALSVGRRRPGYTASNPPGGAPASPEPPSRSRDRQAPVVDQVAALSEKAATLARSGDLEPAIHVLDDLIRRFGGNPRSATPEPWVDLLVAEATYNRGVFYSKLGRREAAVAAYAETAERYRGRLDPGVAETVAKALFNRGVELEQLGRVEEALVAYGDVARRYAGLSEAGVDQRVARALFNRADLLRRLGRTREAADGYDQLVELYGQRPEPPLAEQVVKARHNKRLMLDEADRSRGPGPAIAPLVGPEIVCPSCSSTEVLPFVYGVLNERLELLAQANRVVVGGALGRLTGGTASEWRCGNCGHEWRGGLFTGGDGRSLDEAVVINVHDGAVGIRAERQWLAERLGADFEQLGQMLISGQGGRRFDKLIVRSPNGGTRDVYFDVSAFFGGSASGSGSGSGTSGARA